MPYVERDKPANSDKPQSSRYRCVIEELEKLQSLTRRNGNILLDILNALEGMHYGTPPGTSPGSRPNQQNPVGMETHTRVLEVPREAKFGSWEAPKPTLPVVPPSDGDAPAVSGAQSEAPCGGQTGAQNEDAEKARRIRHGEGLDLDEPQF